MAPGLNVDQAVVLITGHLADVILHWARTAPDGTAPEPVHQMRVAVRRLRTALAVFRRTAPEGALDSLEKELKSVARLLGGARDWDVFLGETGDAVHRPSRRTGASPACWVRRPSAGPPPTTSCGPICVARSGVSSPCAWPCCPPFAPGPPAWPTPVTRSLVEAPAEAYAAQALHRLFKRLAGGRR